MKIFEGGKWGDKVNFVDVNNVFVGYDMGQDCCEYADWFISNNIEKQTEPVGVDSPDEDYSEWVFDRDFFLEPEDFQGLDDGGVVVFRLVNGDSEKFLHLFNSHNGYYGHGFEFGIDGKVLNGDTL
jgi:hypothetical protein